MRSPELARRHSIICDGLTYTQQEVMEIYESAYEKGLADGRNEQKELELQRRKQGNLYSVKPRIF